MYKQEDKKSFNVDFKSIADFQESVRYHAEIEFEHKGKHYGIIPVWDGLPGQILFYEGYQPPEKDIIFDSCEKLLDYVFDGHKMRDIITTLNITGRSI